MKTTIFDYLRLAKATPTVEREFEVFKELVFNHILLWEDGTPHEPGAEIKGIIYDARKHRFTKFDNYNNIGYEEAAAIAYTKYYRAINGFILPFESRALYLDMAINLGPLQAIRRMQICAGVEDDGIIGPVTREKMQYVTPDCLVRENKKQDSLINKLRVWLQKL